MFEGDWEGVRARRECLGCGQLGKIVEELGGCERVFGDEDGWEGGVGVWVGGR